MKAIDYIQYMLDDIFPDGEFGPENCFSDILDAGVEELPLTHFIYALELEYRIELPEDLTDDLNISFEALAKRIDGMKPSDNPYFTYDQLKNVSEEIAACYFREEDDDEFD